MLNGTRLRGSRTKRAEKYANEETESMLVDADSIKVFVENTPSVLTQGVRETSMHENSGPNAKECNTLVFEGRKWTMDPSTEVIKGRKSDRGYFATNTTMRSSRKAKGPVFSIEDKEPCFSPEITGTLSSRFDPFGTNCDRINYKNNAGKVRTRLGENLSQISSEEWGLCNEKDHNASSFKLSGSMKKGVTTADYSDQRVTKISKDDLTFSEDDLVFSDIFREKIKSTMSSPAAVENRLQFRVKRQQNLRRIHSQSEKNVPNHTEDDLFTDFSLSEESSGKSTLREIPWGKRIPGVLHPVSRIPGGSRVRSLSSGESTIGDLYSGKDTLTKKISEENPPQEDPPKLMEDSEDIVNELNNSGGDEFTDSQGERSFVCLVDQLTDLRVRQKFVAHYANRRRQAVCEELEKVWVWNDKCLYEYRRDLNIRTALGNMFL
jgi:hypothetical protein